MKKQTTQKTTHKQNNKPSPETTPRRRVAVKTQLRAGGGSRWGAGYDGQPWYSLLFDI